MVEPNRPSLIRILRVRKDATDTEIVRAIRKLAREFRGFGRPFVLPKDLDLQGCLAAFRKRGREEEALAIEYHRRIVALKRKMSGIDGRILALTLILEAASDPPDGSDGP